MNKCIFLVIGLCISLNIYAQKNEKIDRLELKLKQTSSITETVDLLDSIANLVRNSDTPKSCAYARKGYDLSKKHKYTLGIANTASLIAWYYHYKKPIYDSAMVYYQEAYIHYAKLQVPSKSMIMLSEIGLLYHEQKNLTNALIYQIKALNLADSNKGKVSQRKLGNVYYRIGNIYIEQGDVAKAKYYFEKALLCYQKAKYKRGIGSAYLLLANTYETLQDTTKVIEMRQKSLDIFTEIKDTTFIVPCLMNLADIDKKHVHKSIEYIEKAEQIIYQYRATSYPLDKNYLLYVLGNLSLLYSSINNKVKSRAYFDKFINQLNKHKNTALRNVVKKEIYTLAMNAAIGVNNKEIALEYAKKLLDAKDSLYEENRTKILYELEKKYNTEKKEQKNKTLQIEKEREKQKKQFILIILIIALCVIVILFILSIHLRKINKQLYKQKQELAQLNEVKNKLFSVISHDLRSPVYEMMRYLETLNPSSEKEQKYYTQIREKLFRIENMLNSVLHWAKIHLNEKTINLNKHAVSQIVDEVFEQVQEQVSSKNVLLINEVEDKLFMNTDKTILEIILRNLLTNAIKFSHEGNVVKVFARHKKGKIDIFVQDYGTGMDEQTLYELLNNNQGQSNLGTAKEKGAGLGFQIVLDYIKQLGADIQANSKVNEGTIFQISFSA